MWPSRADAEDLQVDAAGRRRCSPRTRRTRPACPQRGRPAPGPPRARGRRGTRTPSRSRCGTARGGRRDRPTYSSSMNARALREREAFLVPARQLVVHRERATTRWPARAPPRAWPRSSPSTASAASRASSPGRRDDDLHQLSPSQDGGAHRRDRNVRRREAATRSASLSDPRNGDTLACSRSASCTASQQLRDRAVPRRRRAPRGARRWSAPAAARPRPWRTANRSLTTIASGSPRARGLEQLHRGRLAVPRRPRRLQRLARREPLQAAALPARALRAERIHRDVPDLAGRPAHAAPQLPVEHQPGREARAEREEREVLVVTRAARVVRRTFEHVRGADAPPR